MGRATIISELGDGQYTIQPIIDTATSAAEITALTDENAAIDARLVDLETEIAETEFDLNYTMDMLHAAVVNGDDPNDLQDELNKLQITLRAQIASRAHLKLKKVSNEKRIDFLTEKASLPDQVNAWCADLTGGATGIVGTIETGRRNTTPIIKPGAPAHIDATDGRLQPVSLSTPEAAFYNYALITGAAKWRPRFRTGTASNIDTVADTMDVALDALTINGVNCNQTSSLDSVPVEYMTCNAEAFESGDAVVVEFTDQDWASPKVVGFVHDPQPCTAGFWLQLTINGHSCLKGGEQISLRYTKTDASTATTVLRQIPEVGATAAVNESVTIPAANESICGPFNLEDWDETSSVDVLLYRGRIGANTTAGDYAKAPLTSGTKTVIRSDAMFDYYERAADGAIEVSTFDYYAYNMLDGYDGDYAIDVAGFKMLRVRGSQGDAEGYDSGWTEANSFSEARLATNQRFNRIDVLPIATLTAAQITGTNVISTTYSLLDLSSATMVGDQTLISCAGTADIRISSIVSDRKWQYRMDPMQQKSVYDPSSWVENDFLGNDISILASGTVPAGGSTFPVGWTSPIAQQECAGTAIRVHFTVESAVAGTTVKFHHSTTATPIDTEVDVVAGDVAFDLYVKAHTDQWTAPAVEDKAIHFEFSDACEISALKIESIDLNAYVTRIDDLTTYHRAQCFESDPPRTTREIDDVAINAATVLNVTCNASDADGIVCPDVHLHNWSADDGDPPGPWSYYPCMVYPRAISWNFGAYFALPHTDKTPHSDPWNQIPVHVIDTSTGAITPPNADLSVVQSISSVYLSGYDNEDPKLKYEADFPAEVGQRKTQIGSVTPGADYF